MKIAKILGIIALVLVGVTTLTYLLQGRNDSVSRFGGSSVGRSLLVIYMVGSDLEDDYNPRDGVADDSNKAGGYGTSDLNELVKGLKKNNTNNVEVFIGFGGARTDGWKGIRYAGTECILEDSKNNRYGDADCYQFEDRNANMSEEKVYKEFLVAAKAKSSGYKRVYLVNWDHGGDYLGFGADTNFEGDILELGEIRSALQDSDSRYDIIGFDACLMASVEVANSVEGFAPYLLASEEVEPGHGWQYTEVVAALAGSNDPVQVGKDLVDSFVGSRSHSKTSGKTLSLVDLGALPDLRNGIDNALSKRNDSYQHFVDAVDETEAYGMLLTEFSAYAVDLGQLVKNVDSKSASDYSTLSSLISKYVVYSKDDGTRSNSSGVSIYSIKNFNMWNSRNYSESVAATSKWFGSVSNFFEAVKEDDEKPQISNNGKCENGANYSFCVSITDNTALLATGLVNGYLINENTYLLYRSERLQNYSGDNYSTDQNVTKVFGLCNPGESGCVSTLPLALNEVLMGDQKTYLSPAIINGNKGMIHLQFDSNGNVYNQWYITYTKSGDNLFPSKEQYQLKSGDKVQGYYRIYNSVTDQLVLEEGNEVIVLAKGFKWTEDAYEADQSKIALFVYAVDLKGNQAVARY